jgi:hypothetical protein
VAAARFAVAEELFAAGFSCAQSRALNEPHPAKMRAALHRDHERRFIIFLSIEAHLLKVHPE